MELKKPTLQSFALDKILEQTIIKSPRKNFTKLNKPIWKTFMLDVEHDMNNGVDFIRWKFDF